MTTAKPEPMAGQPDESDDLIAELAKLMAQDAHEERPTPPAAPPAPRQPTQPVPQATRPAPQPPTPQPQAFQVRIPGGQPSGASSEPAPTPRFDFDRAGTTAAAGQAAAPRPAAPPVARHEPVSTRQDPVMPRPEPIAPRQEPIAPRQPAPAPRAEPAFVPTEAMRPAPAPMPTPAPADPSELFHFDLGLDARGPSEPVPQRNAPAPTFERVEPQVRPAIDPQIAAVLQRQAPAAPQPAPAPAAPSQADPHDSIADLIAAEFFNDTVEPDVEPAVAPVVDGEPNFFGSAPNSAREPEPVPDRFDVPPVFGLGSATQQSAPPVGVPPIPSPISATPPRAAEPFAPAPRSQQNATPAEPDTAGLDPIDEIEGLIGRARLTDRNEPEIAAPVAERAAPSAALRSLATPTMPANPPPPPRTAAPIPRRLAPKPAPTQSRADDVIAEAAAAAGAEISWVESPEFEKEANEAYAGQAQRKPRGFSLSRRVAAPLVAATFLAAAGFGLYWVLGNAAPSGPAPLLTADDAQVKEVPTTDPAATSANQSVVFNEIDGVQPGADEQLVSRDQADVNEVTQVATPTESTEEGLANRKVRTVTVRPDGTIVSSDDSLAGSSMLPVVRPNVPAVPGAQTASSALTASAEQPAATTPTTAVPEPTTATPAVTVTPVQPGATVSAVDASGTAIPGKTTVIPLAKPSSFRPQPTGDSPAASVNAIIQQTPAASTAPLPAGTQTASAATPLSNAPAYVQLASHRTEAEARQSANTIVSRFGPLFKGANLEVQRIELGDRGVFYRVRVPADSLQSANDLCAQVKGAGGDCFAM